MSWLDQGRQEHGWFGHGTAPPRFDEKAGSDDDLFGPGEVQQRFTATIHGAIAALPANLRARAEARNDKTTVGRLGDLMTARVLASRLDQAAFADKFLGRSADDPVVVELRAAASGAAFAKSHADLGEAARHLANAEQAVGLDQWQRFLVDAKERANDPATVAAVDKSRKRTDIASKDDSITPVYPIETLAGIAAAGIVAGAGAAARVAGGALLRQAMPKPAQPVDAPAGGSPTAAEGIAKPSNAATESTIPAGLTKPSLPANPDELPTQGWKETSHPTAAKMGHRTFENSQTGEIIRFDKGRPGESGFEGQDHYHRLNPNRTSRSDEYLDLNGNPVARGSGPSHIIPRK